MRWITSVLSTVSPILLLLFSSYGLRSARSSSTNEFVFVEEYTTDHSDGELLFCHRRAMKFFEHVYVSVSTLGPRAHLPKSAQFVDCYPCRHSFRMIATQEWQLKLNFRPKKLWIHFNCADTSIVERFSWAEVGVSVVGQWGVSVVELWGVSVVEHWGVQPPKPTYPRGGNTCIRIEVEL